MVGISWHMPNSWLMWKNGICSSYPMLECLCPPHLEMTDPGNTNIGRKPKFNHSCPLKPEEMEFKYLQNADFLGIDINFTNMVHLDECKSRCMNDCSCQGFSCKLGNGVC
ncbi:hypothetical protein IEQ34_005895 [Dendrobium chrysotoxum]|uniref:Apple domain-containing protein n=1 Tax=Dendrobium chrysotoxum TaxID=161865 RepID=A0AAV7HA65_DENCH|nr:hypothetical protein IEQ34_005895 [Dendrobium chrysotoxum]